MLAESNECSFEKPSKPPIKATEQRPNNKGRGWSSCHCFFSSERSDIGWLDQTFVFVAQTLSTLLRTRSFISKWNSKLRTIFLHNKDVIFIPVKSTEQFKHLVRRWERRMNDQQMSLNSRRKVAPISNLTHPFLSKQNGLYPYGLDRLKSCFGHPSRPFPIEGMQAYAHFRNLKSFV